MNKSIKSPQRVVFAQSEYIFISRHNMVSIYSYEGELVKSIEVASKVKSITQIDSLIYIACEDGVFKLESDLSYVRKKEKDFELNKTALLQLQGCKKMEDELWYVDEKSNLKCINALETSFTLNEIDEVVDIAVGVYGDGCGGGRVFIIDGKDNSIKAYHHESKETISIFKHNISFSAISKKGCNLYLLTQDESMLTVFNLSSMEKELLQLKEN